MFWQIFVHPDDRNLLLLLWRENKTEPLKIHRLTTVPFGLPCSPSLTISTLKQLVKDEGYKYLRAAVALNSQICR